jgi:peroxiredoxin
MGESDKEALLRSPSGPLRLWLTSSAAGAKETISAGLHAAAALAQGGTGACAVVATSAGWVRAAAQAPRVGQVAPVFNVTDSTGQARQLAEFQRKTVVLEWSSTSCPFAAAQYKGGRMPELQRWARERDVVWLTVLSSHPSRSDYLAAPQAQAFNSRRGGAPTALLIDSDGKVGRAYGAATANHMFVIDTTGVLAYAGGIDDSESMDPQVVSRSHSHVRAALEDLLAGRSVRVAETKPYGCALAYAG